MESLRFVGALAVCGAALALNVWVTRNNWRHYRRGAFPMGNGGAYITRKHFPGQFRLLAVLLVGGPALFTLAVAATLFLNAIGRL